MTNTQIYIIDISSIPKDQLDKIINDFNEPIKSLINNHKEKNKYIQSLIGYHLLRKCLLNDYQIKLDDIEVFQNKYNKPFLKDNLVYFNLSHSYNLISLVICTCPCGIDVQLIDQTKNYQLNNDKLINYNQKDFIEQWTKIESYYKMKGNGLVFSKIKDYINTKKELDKEKNYFENYLINDILNNEYSLSVYIEKNTSEKIYLKTILFNKLLINNNN